MDTGMSTFTMNWTADDPNTAIITCFEGEHNVYRYSISGEALLHVIEAITAVLRDDQESLEHLTNSQPEYGLVIFAGKNLSAESILQFMKGLLFLYTVIDATHNGFPMGDEHNLFLENGKLVSLANVE